MVEIRRGSGIGRNVGGALGTAVGGPLGGIAGGVVGQILADALGDAMNKAGQQPTNTMSQAQAQEVTPDVINIALRDPRIRDIAKHVENVTNNDKPSQSLVTQGAVVGGLGGAVSIVAVVMAGAELAGYDWSGKEAALTVFVGGLMTLGGAAWTLYGRWRSRKLLIGAR